MKAKDILEEAAEVLERDGWSQCFLKDDNGRRCVMGAINKVVSIEDKYGETWYPSELLPSKKTAEAIKAYKLLLKRIGHFSRKLHLGAVELLIARWNDDDDRSQDEVIGMLRNAADS